MSGENELEFLMGEYRALFPVDRHYVTNHMWAVSVGPNRLRFGLTRYAVRLLQDVYFLDWDLAIPATVSRRQQIGSIESKKAESDIFSPCAGEITAINSETLDDPSVINVDPYGDGWLLEMETTTAELLSPTEYVEHLATAWKVAERTIKGQIQ